MTFCCLAYLASKSRGHFFFGLFLAILDVSFFYIYFIILIFFFYLEQLDDNKRTRHQNQRFLSQNHQVVYQNRGDTQRKTYRLLKSIHREHGKRGLLLFLTSVGYNERLINRLYLVIPEDRTRDRELIKDIIWEISKNYNAFT